MMAIGRALFLAAGLWVYAAGTSPAGEPEHWRFGVGVATQNMIDGQATTNLEDFDSYRPTDEPWNALGLGWYFNWNWQQGIVCDASGSRCVEYMPLVGGWGSGVHPTLPQIADHLNANPGLYPDGTTWLIGNEIIWDDRRTPLQYAQDYHTFYYGLKAINPTFKVANGSVITSVHYNRTGFTGTPYELLDAIWDAYLNEYGETWPVDVWNIHPYVWTKATVQEELDDLANQLSTFRDWMAAKGQQNKPLIITEYGLLNDHDPQWMIDFLLGSFEVLLSGGHANGMTDDQGRWVQRWAWFVNNMHVWEAGGAIQWEHCALHDAEVDLDDDGEVFDIRALGQAYADHPKFDNCPATWNPLQGNADGDEYGDACDNCPLATNTNQANADGDNWGDACDGCPDDPLKAATGFCGCGVPDSDADGDAVMDCADECPNTPPGSHVTLSGCPTARPDLDRDGDVDQVDFGLFQACMSGPGIPSADTGCERASLDTDNDVDSADIVLFSGCISGPSIASDPECIK